MIEPRLLIVTTSSVLLNCVGPYFSLGESVVKAVLAANESRDVTSDSSPTDYIDLSGEPAWIEEMTLRYGDRAARLGCSIIHAAAFDSVPSDLGAVLVKQQLTARGATPTSIEAFVRLHSRSAQKLGIHYATYEAAVNGFSTRKQLSFVRRQLYSKLPKLKPAPLTGNDDAQQRSNGLPKRKGQFNHIPPHEEHVGGVYVIPFFFADPAVVRLSQHLSARMGQSEENPPAQAVFWFVIPSLSILLVTLLALTLFGLMASFSLGRTLLLKYPAIFSAGMVSHSGPTQQQLDDYSFSTTLVARGYSQSAAKDPQQLQPDVKAVVRIRGPEVGYVSTPILFVQVARTILSEREAVNNGVLTPGSALLRTSLVERLNKDGRVTFSVLS